MDRPTVPYCSGDCGDCNLGPAQDRPGTLRGPTMAGAAMLSFLLPLVGLLGGAILAGAAPLAQLPAALIGLLAGAALARTLAGRLGWEGRQAGS